VLIEIFTRHTPYQFLTNGELLSMMRSSTKAPSHPIPSTCPPSLAKVMNQCWTIDPTERPTFATLWKQLNEISSDNENTEISLAASSKLTLTTAKSWKAAVPDYDDRTPKQAPYHELIAETGTQESTNQ
jgi:hypothetical protein